MLHISGDHIKIMTDVLACAISRDHESLLIVTAEGFECSRGLNGRRVATFPWPVAPPRKLDAVQISNDARRVMFADDELGVWLATARRGGADWTRLYPTSARLADRQEEAPDEEYSWFGSMTHCAISPDGRFAAYGCQDEGHFIDTLADNGSARRWATIGYRSEYPHDACFSDDGRFAALNSCHFYHRATIGVEVKKLERVQTPNYEDDPRVRLLNSYLRVYASTWLPTSALGIDPGLFALCGVGILTCVTPSGNVACEQYFGSSASAVDYCPKTRRMIVASCSGFLHLYDVDATEMPGRAIGYNAMRELYRWIFWKDFRPFRW